ncbi:MAG: FTR1 family protein [Chloroflexi bacterium]|nr:FTR1 family protein [Chloroflexota bacterium]
MGPSLVITVREGLEASLIIGILCAYLLRTGRKSLLRYLWYGVGAALAASLGVAAAALLLLGGLSGAVEEVVEGIVGLAAVGVLSYVILWMGQRSRSLKQEMERQVESAVRPGSGMGLAALAFAAVFREGAETVLYLAAAGRASPPAGIAAGAALGGGLAVTLGYMVYRGSRWVNLRLFFTITTAVLVVFGAGMVSQATRAFQAAGVFPGTIAAWDMSALLSETSLVGSFLVSLVGYSASPSVLQLIIGAAYLAVMGYLLLGRSSADPQADTEYSDPFRPLSTSYSQRLYHLVRHPLVPSFLSGLMLVLFLGLLAIGVFELAVGPFTNEGPLALGPFSTKEVGNNIFNLALWVLWLPLVSLSAVFVGRLWCGNLCPLRSVTEWVRSLAERLLGRGTPTAPFIRMGWVLPMTFILITLYARSFPVQSEARWGAATFLGIVAIAVLLGAFFRRGTWCRYICPIGGWLARIARLSIFSVRPKLDICATCPDKPCLTPPSSAARCPTLLNPSRLDSSRYCIACWSCVKSCPPERAGMHLGVRVPGAELLRPSSPNTWEAVFIAALMGMYIAVIGQGVILPQAPWPLVYLGLLGMGALAYLAVAAVSSVLGGLDFRDALRTLGYAFLPLEFAMALITFGDETLEFFGLTAPAVALLLGIGFAWSLLLTASIARHNARSARSAVLAAAPVAAALVGVLFLWAGWFLSGQVIDLT